MESIFQDYKNEGDGFVVIQLLGMDGGYNPPDQSDLQAWINYIKNAYGVSITYVVASDPYFSVGNKYNKTGYIPYYWMVDQDLIIVKKGSSPNSYRSMIEDLLGLDN